MEFKIVGFVKDVGNKEISYFDEEVRATKKFSISELILTYLAKIKDWNESRKQNKDVYKEEPRDILFEHSMSSFRTDWDRLEQELFEISLEYQKHEFYEIEISFFKIRI